MSGTRAGTCRICGCTDEAACEGGCSWADAAQTLCSLCLEAALIATQFVDVIGAVMATRKLPPTWKALSAAQQQLLVMTCRATAEAIQEGLQEGFDSGPAQELAAIVEFLQSHQVTAPDAESISATVIRLLQPHIGSRIILPRSF